MININNKEWGKLRSSDIQKYLLDGEEDYFFEYKEDDVKPSDFVNEVTAFSNTYGGYILLGVSDTKAILGCTKWTEERITNTIFNGITPLPIFDIKKFQIEEKVIYVIKIEEGNMSPYITNKGSIYERVSSSSCKITNSAKLDQLFNKGEKRQKDAEKILSLPTLSLDKSIPNNLCAYIDFGFDVTNSRQTTLQQDWINFDFTPIAEYLRINCGAFSISRIGRSFTISIGRLETQSHSEPIRAVSALHNFIEVMLDGSVRGRLILFCDKSTKVDICSIINCNKFFVDIYKLIFGQNFSTYFVSALKYEKITVIKQFTPYYSAFENDEVFSKYLQKHQQKYGNNLVISGNRIPPTGFHIIDKRLFEDHNIEFNNDRLIEELFYSYYCNLGYLDSPGNQGDSDI